MTEPSRQTASAKLRTETLYFPCETEVQGPTRHQPGSAEKISVLVARQEAGVPLFDPADAKLAR